VVPAAEPTEEPHTTPPVDHLNIAHPHRSNR
jgi:hypothetical protein